jgi:FtsP/CotA-like multicopper oxidase with cupredoxin domain
MNGCVRTPRDAQKRYRVRIAPGFSAQGHIWFLQLLCLVLAFGVFAGSSSAQTADPADQVCARFAPGSVVPMPPDLLSQNGVLEVTFKFETVTDTQGLTRSCYVTDGGLESPTLHVHPGDQLIIHFQNDLPPAGPAPMAAMTMKHGRDAASSTSNDCAGGPMSQSTTNLHFHGMNVAPTCHQDDVVKTLIQPAGTFDYVVQIPADEPPGLYWYHPHPHGFSNNQVQGGAAGALIVEGIQTVNPAVAGLPQRLFVLRDQVLPQSGNHDPGTPSCDISLNYVPIFYPSYTPAIIQTPPGTSEFWRVVNASANTIFDLQYLVNGVAQQVQVVAIDGVPVGQGTGQIQSVNETTILLPPGARAEFIATTPNLKDQAQLVTQHWDTGPAGASHPTRSIANIVAQTGVAQNTLRLPLKARAAKATRFASLSTVVPDARRALYFSESFGSTNGPNGFFLTVEGQTPAVYDPSAPPNIVVHQGSTEDWTVENRAQEDHVFHIHQLHFQVLRVNGQSDNDPALRDTVIVPHWSGAGPYPSVTLRMDFRDANIVGLFVYHCHLLGHEDGGMMGAIQVLPPGIATSTTISASSSDVNLNSNVTFTATITPATPGTPITGTVQFVEDGIAIGSPVAVANGQAVFATSLATNGTHSITAAYSGDADCNESMSDTLSVTVEDFALSASNLMISAAGQSGSTAITVTPSSGFTSEISFGCSLPSSFLEATCSVSPNSLTGGGKVLLTVNTTSPGRVTLVDGRLVGPPIVPGGSFAGAAAALACLCLLIVPRRKWREAAMFGVFLSGVAFLVFACGTKGRTDPGTPSGSYTAIVKATSGSGSSLIQHSLTLQVDVQ